jgi:eukaryotic-like serine/threonine-protein kinase
MPIAESTRLGPYTVLSPLGSGGMGEVYLAEDTRLHRKVALKILPSELASEQDRMRRFYREAMAAAALNHPHIAHIYEIAKAEGMHFIAMEYIDGETLREKIHRDKTLLSKLLKYLVQTAEGLTKAHAAGIVHRDLKPDNIMITRDDYAKILDFGLAKLVEPKTSFVSTADSLSEIPTAIMPERSLPGAVMGTAGYMSPEQAQGRVREIDHRSDIFSFGCILFEAVTGHKAFEGEDTLDSLHKIVHMPAPQIKDFNPAAPAEIQRIVQRCLAKDPNKRYHSIKDVALELEELRQDLKNPELETSVSPPFRTGASAVSEAGPEGTQQLTDGATTGGVVHSTSSAEYVVNEIKRHKRGALVALAALLLLVAGGFFAFYKFLGRRPTFAARPLKITRLTSTGQVNHAAISPDGKYVVYVQNEGEQEALWITQVAVSSTVRIVPLAERHYQGITFSHDGNFIYYVRIDKDNPSGALYQMPALGGNARKLLVNILSPITISPDGKRIAFVRCENCLTFGADRESESALIVANADGSEEKKLAVHQFPDMFSPGGPAWSPDGNVIACGKTHRRGGGGPYRNVVALRVSDGMEQPMTSQQWDGPGVTNMRITWLADESGILVSGVEQGRLSQIWYLAWPGSEARNVTNDLNSYSDLSLTADSGTLVSVRADRTINLWTARNQDTSAARRITSGAERADGERGISWTPEGRIVYSSTAGGTGNIWITQPDGAENKPLTATGAQNVEPAVSPDGHYVAWASRRAGQWELWRMDIDGNNPKKLTGGGYFQDISHDGKWIIYSTPPATLWKIPIDGGDPVRLTEAKALRPAISPDGQLIACNYEDQASGQIKIAIIPVSGGAPIKLLAVSPANGIIRWTPDGRALAYIVDSNHVSNIWVQPLDGESPKQLTDFKSEQIFNFAWSRDGQQLALSRGVVNRDVVLISGFK